MSFLFISNSAPTWPPNVIVVLISKLLSSKEILLAEFARQADFPEYFGKNWDAFEECLHDLSWLNDRHLVIFHDGLPFENSENELKNYLKILNQAVLDWKKEDPDKFLVVFTQEARYRIQSLIEI